MTPLPAFRNEAYADFSLPENKLAMETALAQVRATFGREYSLWIAGRAVATEDWLRSVNPSHPDEIVGSHAKASAALATEAIADAAAFFPEWARTPVVQRVEIIVKTAAILRARKNEFNAWLVLEAGKSWPEAEAETAEAIDFCEYYARQMVRWANPEPLLQMDGEKNELEYLPLGVGIVIPPWNFPLAILAGMAVAALVCGNTVVLKPSSETPVIAAKFVEVLWEAGLPPRALALCVGSGGEIGDLLVVDPQTRFISFTGSREVGLHINALAAKPAKGLKWIRRVVAEMGGKDAIIVDADCDLDAAVAGVVASAFGFQGQKCSACSRAIVHADVYDEFLLRLEPRVAGLTVGDAADPAFAMGPVISLSARQSILNYIEVGRLEGGLLTGGHAAPGDGYYVAPTVFSGVPSTSRLFQEEIFGPVLAVTKADDFHHALALANDSDYGLTGAVYSNVPAHLELARRDFHVGNLYLNRKCTGAMVGVHPFGGFNLSGTDSKAGGPDYLLQFLQAKSIATKLP